VPCLRQTLLQSPGSATRDGLRESSWALLPRPTSAAANLVFTLLPTDSLGHGGRWGFPEARAAKSSDSRIRSQRLASAGTVRQRGLADARKPPQVTGEGGTAIRENARLQGHFLRLPDFVSGRRVVIEIRRLSVPCRVQANTSARAVLADGRLRSSRVSLNLPVDTGKQDRRRVGGTMPIFRQVPSSVRPRPITLALGLEDRARGGRRKGTNEACGGRTATPGESRTLSVDEAIPEPLRQAQRRKSDQMLCGRAVVARGTYREKIRLTALRPTPPPARPRTGVRDVWAQETTVA